MPRTARRSKRQAEEDEEDIDGDQDAARGTIVPSVVAWRHGEADEREGAAKAPATRRRCSRRRRGRRRARRASRETMAASLRQGRRPQNARAVARGAREASAIRAASQRLKTRMMTSSAAGRKGIATTLKRTNGSSSAAVGGRPVRSRCEPLARRRGDLGGEARRVVADDEARRRSGRRAAARRHGGECRPIGYHSSAPVGLAGARQAASASAQAIGAPNTARKIAGRPGMIATAMASGGRDRRDRAAEGCPSQAGDRDRQRGEDEERQGEQRPAERRHEEERRAKPAPIRQERSASSSLSRLGAVRGRSREIPAVPQPEDWRMANRQS